MRLQRLFEGVLGVVICDPILLLELVYSVCHFFERDFFFMTAPVCCEITTTILATTYCNLLELDLGDVVVSVIYLFNHF